MGDGTLGRRAFLKLGTVGTAAAVTGVSCGAEEAAPPAAAAGKLAFRTLGRTGMKITVVSVGSMRTEEEAVFRAAFDYGVNYIDTARGYTDGRNEGIVGRALKGYRDKVYVATKVAPSDKARMKADIDESLKQLQVDYVDLLQLHNITSGDSVTNPEYREVLAEAKASGKTRFIGVTTHKNEAKVLDAVTNDPDQLYDTVLVTYNFKKGPDVKEAIARAAAKKVGVIAMKTQQGGYKTRELGDISPHQAALKWVLQDTNVTAAIPSMVDLGQVKENLAVMGLPLTATELAVLKRYSDAIEPYYCYRCGACEATCRGAVDIAEVNRCLMYAEGYGDLALARSTYAELPAGAGVSACTNCAECTARCAHSINIAKQVEKARALLA